MKWALLALALGASLVLALTLWSSSSPLAPYERLSRVISAPDKHGSDLWQLAGRSDAAGWVARLELAKGLMAHGEARSALPLLREALALRGSQEARRLLAQALEASGSPGEALAEWTKLLPNSDAAQALLRLEKDRTRAGNLLVVGGAYAEALQALSGLTSSPAVLGRARALAGMGRLREAAQTYEQYLALAPHDAQARVEYGQVWESLGDLERARAAYAAAGAAGAYRLGLLLEAQGDPRAALEAYLRGSEPEARWRASRLLEAQGRTEQALILYQELARSSARVADDAALRAFLLLSQKGRKKEASSFKAQLPSAFLWFLGEKVSPPSTVLDPWPIIPEGVALAEDLVRHFPERGKEWAYINLEITLSRASPAEVLAIGEWYAKQGDWRRALGLGARVIGQSPCPRAYRLAYPRAWEESVLRWAREYGVDPFLVWAVMREESSFDPTAVSSSDARGLLQLLPSTARWIAQEKLGIPYREDFLFDPDYNIRLGTWYLRHLLEQLGGDVAWAVAAYNGGPGNLRRWTAGLTDPRDFPAALRSPETREYLTKVLNSWLIYRWLYG